MLAGPEREPGCRERGLFAFPVIYLRVIALHHQPTPVGEAGLVFALEHLDHALPVRIGDRVGTGRIHNMLAVVYTSRGKYEEAAYREYIAAAGDS